MTDISPLLAWLECNTLMSDNDTDIDLILCKVNVKPTADETLLKECISKHSGVYNDVDIFDGAEHGYIELGGWLGDQGLALRLMAAGYYLKMWNLLTPRTMLGDGLPENMYLEMAGKGLVTMLYPFVERAKVKIFKEGYGQTQNLTSEN